MYNETYSLCYLRPHLPAVVICEIVGGRLFSTHASSQNDGHQHTIPTKINLLPGATAALFCFLALHYTDCQQPRIMKSNLSSTQGRDTSCGVCVHLSLCFCCADVPSSHLLTDYGPK